ncbi:MAG: signal peptidase I [Treponemataceae bacterium]|nr:signal peptidase I [Treponemataceae bacterium]
MNKELYELSYSMKKELERKVATAVLFAVGFFAAVNLILAFVVFPVRQRSVSMTPDIPADSCIFFTPLGKGASRGDVVLIRPRSSEPKSAARTLADVFVGFFTAQQLVPSSRRNLMGSDCQIRRVIGMPGDTIYMRDYVLYVKPAGGKYFLTEFELVKKPYNVGILAAPAGWDNSVGVVGSFDAMTLGRNEYFVLGDQRNSCMDSRLWGPVDGGDVQASAVAVYFPLNKLRLF